MLCRALHDAALMLVFGTALLNAAVLPPPLRRRADRRLARIATIALPVIVATALVRMSLASADMGEGWRDALDPATLRSAAFDTAFGRAWLVHLAVVSLMLPSGFGVGRGRKTPLVALSGLALATLALTGHAAAVTGPAEWFARAALALHLLAAGAWVGSLPEVLILLGGLADGGSRHDAALALRRFSVMGHGAVAVAITCGAVTTLAIAGLPVAWTAASYAIVLLVKLALVAAMAGLAVVNRYRLVPRLERDGEAARRTIARNTRTALGLGTLAITVAGLLGILAPP